MTPSRSKPLYRYRLTRLGFHFLFVALFAIIGGSLRGFNLLLVLAGLLISVVMIQWRQGRSSIRRTRVSRHPIQGSFAGTPMTIRYEVGNIGRWFPLWGIRIEDRVVAQRRQDRDDFSAPLSTEEQSDDGGPIELNGSVGYVPAGQARVTAIHCRFSHRGLYKLGPVVASTTFPFCLMNGERLSARPSDPIYVYPRLLELRRGWTALLPPRRGGDGNRSTGGTNHDGEFFGLRPWQSGDHVKHIHWRTTARIGQPAVRQFEQRNRHQICVIVDGVPSSSSTNRASDFELVLQLAATLVSELSTQSRSIAMLVADALTSETSVPTDLRQSSGTDLSAVLERLSIAECCRTEVSEIDPLAHAVTAASSQLRQYDIIVVSSRRFDDAAGKRHVTATGDQAIAVWRFFDSTGRLSWLDVHSPTVRRSLGLDTRVTKTGVSDQETADARR